MQIEAQHAEARVPPEHQISFTVDNVTLIDRDQKLETRRLIRFDGPRNHWGPPPDRFPVVQVRDGFATWHAEKPGDFPAWGRAVRCPYGVPGDTLWLRETWQLIRTIDKKRMEFWADKIPKAHPGNGWEVWYRSNLIAQEHFNEPDIKWKPNIFMPRWACGRLLKVESVHAERLHDITHEGALAEGVESVERYMQLWDSINRKRAPSASNPWVFVVRFSKLVLQ